jgi:hypothetical protein
MADPAQQEETLAALNIIIKEARKKRWRKSRRDVQTTKKGFDVVLNRGRVVSKMVSEHSKKNVWIVACKRARAALNINGFCLIKKGTPLYQKALEFKDMMK